MNREKANRILGITNETPSNEIRKIYAKLLIKYHPEEFPEEFMEVNEAYEFVMNIDKVVHHFYTGGQTMEPDTQLFESLWQNSKGDSMVTPTLMNQWTLDNLEQLMSSNVDKSILMMVLSTQSVMQNLKNSIFEEELSKRVAKNKGNMDSETYKEITKFLESLRKESN